MRRFVSALGVAVLFAAAAFSSSGPVPADTSPALNAVVDKIVDREHELLKALKGYTPLAETYIQNVQPDRELGTVPSHDAYYLAQLDLRHGINAHSFIKPSKIGLSTLKNFVNVTSMRYDALGFIQMIVPDATGFDRKHYDFKFVRREFLGEVRTLVFDVAPRRGAGKGRFLGRIWVEDQEYNIVRFNGTYVRAPLFSQYFHFDSWRLNLQPGVWLPAYIYVEESDLHYSIARKLRLKGQTRIWGYGLKSTQRESEFTNVLVDSATVQDHDAGRDLSPVQEQRAWERQAEDNVLERLQKAGLLAPDGEVSKVLETVVNNLEITNNLDIQPEVRARVLLTAQLESFTIGHTIVLSRGLIDVLPDEASLAMALAHELAHISLGHRLDTKYAFSDRMLFKDPQSFSRFQLKRDEDEENAADKKSLELLKNSPYKDKLANAGLFLRALASEAEQFPRLVRPHYGNRLVKGSELMRLAELMTASPKLERARVDQIAALPLGGRIKLDPWDDHIEMMKAKPVPLLSAREKMPFEVTPVIINLTRKRAAAELAATPETKPEKPQ